MELTVNGIGRAMPDGATVAEVVAATSHETRGLAVAVNGEVVPRTVWLTTTVRDGDRVEVLAATQGG
jgi:sulfur carrier protein